MADTKMEQSAPQEESEPKRAPGDLATVQSFINTFDLRPANDALTDAGPLKTWFAEHGLLSKNERLSETDVRHALEVREALRDVLSANAGKKPSRTAVQTLSRTARGAQLLVQFDEGGNATLTPVASGVDQALGRLLAIASRSMLDGSWQRLKACEDETCRWAFYDWSKNRSGNWCSMSSCGNRLKARRYRSRQRPTAPATRARDRQ